MKKPILLLLMFLAVFSALAKEYSVAPQQELKQTLAVPAPAEGDRVILRFLARLQGEMKIGAQYAMKIRVDGKLLDNRVNNVSRVVNRNAETFHGTIYPYTSGGAWNVAANPREEYIEIVYVPEDYSQVYYYELDISDVLQGSHEFSWENVDAEKRTLQIKDPGVTVKTIENLLPENIDRQWSDNPGIQTREYELSVAREGLGIQLAHGGKRYYIESSVSYPGGGMNRLFCQGGNAVTKEKTWQVSCLRKGEDTLLIQGRGEYYEWTRELICRPQAVKVRETFRSLSQDVLGIRFANLVIPEQKGGKIYRAGMTGNPSSTGTHENPAPNSTLFFQNGSGVGVVLEDDVFRLQCDYKVNRDGTATFGTSHLGFPPNGSHTLEWSIYPTRSGDYFDFINQVRKDWNVEGQTIPGTIAWTQDYGSVETARTHLTNAGTAFPGLYWFDLDRAPKNPSAPLEERLKGFEKRLQFWRQVTDQTCVHLLQTVFMRRNVRGQPLAFADSCVIGPNGKVVEYSPGYRGKIPGQYHVLRYYTLENSFYQYVSDIISISLKMGIRGFYFDTPNHINSHYGRFTYDRWDGCTVDLDAKFRVKRKYADLCLISGDARLALAQKILQAGGFVFYNDPPMLRKMASLKGNVVFLTEGDYPCNLARQHLCTPIAFGEHFSDRDPTMPLYGRRKTWLGAEDLMDDMLWKLKNGVLYQMYRAPLGKATEKISSVILDHPFPTAFMYPITVTDIHAGWVRGKERIVTSLSGKYGWPDKPAQVEVRIFDRTGRNIETQMLSPDEDDKFAVSVPEKGMAILSRKME